MSIAGLQAQPQPQLQSQTVQVSLPPQLAGLRSGDSVTARVVAQLADGTVRLSVGGNTVEAQLQVPPRALPQAALRAGAEVHLQVVRDGVLLKLLLSPSAPAGGGGRDGRSAALPRTSPQAPVQTSPTPAGSAAGTAPGTAQGTGKSPAPTAVPARGPKPAPVQPLPQPVQPVSATPSAATAVNTAGAESPAATQRLLVQQSAGGGAPQTSPTSPQASGATPPASPNPARLAVAPLLDLAASAARGAGLGEAPRQAAGRLLGLSPTATSAPVAATGSGTGTGTAIGSPPGPAALASLFTSLAETAGQARNGTPEFVRTAAAKLLDLAPPAARGVGAEQGSARLSRPAGLFQAAAQLLQTPSAAVPEAVRAAARAVLALRADASALSTGEGLRQAVETSGLFYEMRLAQGMPLAASADTKGALLLLRNLLQSWLGGSASGDATGKPTRPGATGSLPPNGPSPGPAPQDIARLLLKESETALSRLRTAQVAALPERADGAATAPPGARAEQADLNLQIPVLIGGKSELIELDIGGDAEAGEADGKGAWRVRLYLDFDPFGPTRAVVTLRGAKVAVRIRAEKRETAALFAQSEELLRAMLADEGLEVGEISAGVTRAEPLNLDASALNLVDRRT